MTIWCDNHVPVFHLDMVFHVGTLDPADKGRVTQSLEGSGLSVSVHPDEWTRIARLGGAPRWRIARADGAPLAFLDVHRVDDTLSAAIMAWAVDEGLVVPASLWQVTVPDEVDDHYTMWFDDPDEAAAEADPDYVDGATVCEVDSWAATAAMRELMGHACPPGFAEVFAPVIWAEHVARLDGAWWQDRYDPSGLSCPRGVIHRSRMDAMVATPAD